MGSVVRLKGNSERADMSLYLVTPRVFRPYLKSIISCVQNVNLSYMYIVIVNRAATVLTTGIFADCCAEERQKNSYM